MILGTSYMVLGKGGIKEQGVLVEEMVNLIVELPPSQCSKVLSHIYVYIATSDIDYGNTDILYIKGKVLPCPHLCSCLRLFKIAVSCI